LSKEIVEIVGMQVRVNHINQSIYVKN